MANHKPAPVPKYDYLKLLIGFPQLFWHENRGLQWLVMDGVVDMVSSVKRVKLGLFLQAHFKSWVRLATHLQLFVQHH